MYLRVAAFKRRLPADAAFDTYNKLRGRRESE